MSQSQVSEVSERDLASSPDVGRPVSVAGVVIPGVTTYPFGTGTQGTQQDGSDSGAESTAGALAAIPSSVAPRPARKGKAKTRVTALGGIVEGSGAEESESLYESAVRAKGSFGRDRSLDALVDPSVPARRTPRVSAGKPPAWLETSEIKGGRRAPPSPAAGHRTAWSK
jgi:hypothetical protein